MDNQSELKIVVSSTQDQIEMDGSIFRGDFNGLLTTATLNKLNEYADIHKAGQVFQAKSTRTLGDVVIVGVKHEWDQSFIEKLFDSL